VAPAIKICGNSKIKKKTILKSLLVGFELGSLISVRTRKFDTLLYPIPHSGRRVVPLDVLLIYTGVFMETKNLDPRIFVPS